MGTEGISYTSVRPRDTVGTLAFLERGRDAARRAETIAWVCAFVSLGLATLFAILWLVSRFGPSDVQPEPCASAASRVVPGGDRG